MTVRIKYCVPCEYRRHAEALADQIRSRLHCDVQLERGNFGVFKVWRDDRLVYDKRTTRGLLGKLGFGEIPTPELILRRLKDARC